MSVLRRLWFLLRRNRLEAELREEMAFHLEERARALAASDGLDEEAARHEARRRFGNLTRAREDSRASWGFRTLDLLGQDVRYAMRTLARQPLLVAIAVVSLGSAMAAGTAVFSLADAVLFARLPVPQPDRLVGLRWVAAPGGDLFRSLNGWGSRNDKEESSTSFSLDAFVAARQKVRGRAELFAFADLYQVSVAAAREPEVATAQVVSGNYFSALGIRPALGRFINAADDRLDAPEAAGVISYAYWQRGFGGARDVVGRTVRVNGVPTTIVGVAPAGFHGTRQVGDTSDLSLPMALRDRYVRDPAPDAPTSADPAFWWVIMMARLADGVDVRAIQPELETAIRQRVGAFRPDALKRAFRVDVLPGARGQIEQRREMVEPIATMGAIVVAVILIACANLANLLLARGAARDREISVRLAIGASRARVVKQQLVESALIGLAAGVAGVVVARWLAQGLVPALGFEPGAPGIQIAINARVLAFGFVASVLCTMIFGLLPALRCSTVPAVRSLRGATDAAGAFAIRGGRLRLARLVLVAQVALSVVVLVAAGLLVHSMRNLERVNPGFDPRGVLLFRVDPTLLGYDAPRIRHICSRIVDRLREVPAVDDASFSHIGLLYGSSSISSVDFLDGKPPSERLDVNRLIVEPGFFRLFRIPVLAGRTFSGSERDGAVIPAIINRTFAERGFKTLNAVGHTFKLSNRPNQPTYEVIGVVGDVRLVHLERPVPPTMYFPYTADVLYGATFALSTAVAPEQLADTVRGVVARVDRDLPVDRIRSQEAEVRHSLREERLFATLATLLGALALLLACVGIYALMAYAVARRTQEIGVRMALGAERRRVLLMVVTDAARVALTGIVAGLLAAVLCSRYLQSRLFGLTPTDPVALVGATALLLAMALLAAYLPARRASRVDPLVALKAE